MAEVAVRVFMEDGSSVVLPLGMSQLLILFSLCIALMCALACLRWRKCVLFS